ELELQRRGRLSPRAGTRGHHFPTQLAQSLGRLLLGFGAGRRRPHYSSGRGADAPRTLLVPLRVELLSDCCAASNPAFDSRIFFMVRCVFLLGVADDSSPEASVVSTSDSL